MDNLWILDERSPQKIVLYFCRGGGVQGEIWSKSPALRVCVCVWSLPLLDSTALRTYPDGGSMTLFLGCLARRSSVALLRYTPHLYLSFHHRFITGFTAYSALILSATQFTGTQLKNVLCKLWAFATTLVEVQCRAMPVIGLLSSRGNMPL